MRDRPGAVHTVIDLVRKIGGRIAYAFSATGGATPGFRIAYMRIYDMEPEDFSELLKKMMKKCTLRYVIDPFLNKRDIYEE